MFEECSFYLLVLQMLAYIPLSLKLPLIIIKFVGLEDQVRYCTIACIATSLTGPRHGLSSWERKNALILLWFSATNSMVFEY